MNLVKQLEGDLIRSRIRDQVLPTLCLVMLLRLSPDSLPPSPSLSHHPSPFLLPPAKLQSVKQSILTRPPHDQVRAQLDAALQRGKK